MSNSLNCSNQQIPSYSGVTININNPALAVGNNPEMGSNPQCSNAVQSPIYSAQPTGYIVKDGYLVPIDNMNNDVNNKQSSEPMQNSVQPQMIPAGYFNANPYATNPMNNNVNSLNAPENVSGNVVPQTVDEIQNPQNQSGVVNETVDEQAIERNMPSYEKKGAVNILPEQEENTDTSKAIIEDLDDRMTAQKEAEKNGKKVRVVSLTNEYIMSLENYLNNPNLEVRLMASKEVLKRLDEDKSRYDDAALNALLNKMLQDPEKIIRIAAMSAFSSELASGNDYTMQLLNQMQNNPQADSEDVLEASQILLKRSASTEVKTVPQNVPMQNNGPVNQEIQESEG